MLVHEYSTEDFLEARYEEGIEEGNKEGFEKRNNELIENARKALADGIPIEHIQKITGFDLETINGMQ